MNYTLINPIKCQLEAELIRIFKKMDIDFNHDNFLVPAKKIEFGHLSFPSFLVAKSLRKNPIEVCKKIITELNKNEWIIDNFDVTQVGPYINFKAKSGILIENLFETENFKNEVISERKTIVMDYSHPNIAKPFGIGHLRSTVIGASIKRIYEFFGYEVIGVNHLGDWGTQFGKLIEAYKRWGNPVEFEKEPIEHLFSLYVKFHKCSQTDSSLDELSRQWFKKLEDGDEEALSIWKKFRELSLKEFKKYYKKLGVEFESYNGEAFYKDKIEDAIDRIINKKITEESDGALVVELDNKPPLLLRKSDGASTYATRDLAAVFYRIENYSPDKILYVVGTPQKLHFQQLFETLEKAGYNKEIFSHVDFGLIKFKDMKMSTRKGNVIFLKDVISKAVGMAKTIITEKNPSLENQDEIAEMVGLGAIIFGDLSNDRIKNIEFDWDRVLTFEGDTGPYIQYTYVRLKSILRKVADFYKMEDFEFDDYERNLLWMIYLFREYVYKSALDYKPSYLATYLIDLSKMFNNFYHKYSVIKETDLVKKNSRLFLISAGSEILYKGMGILGIRMPEKM